jgi:chemotaxis protein MotA
MHQMSAQIANFQPEVGNMDLSTIVGIFGAFGLVTFAIAQGGGVFLFLNIPSAVIVFGGTLGATLVNYPFNDVFTSFAVVKKTLAREESAPAARIEQLVRFAGKARKEGILSLQSVLSEVADPFFVKGLQMAVDGQEPESLKGVLRREIEYIQERHEKGGEILMTMGSYAPAMGMIGTLIGLVQMLQTMDDPSTIGPAMAVALLTTLYGALAANILCIPMAGQLKNRSREEVLNKVLVVEGIGMILEGSNPRIIEQKLHAFVAPNLRKSNFNKK